jgi:hypothetical protein
VSKSQLTLLETPYGAVELDEALLPDFRQVVRGWNDLGVHVELGDVAWAYTEQQGFLGPTVDPESDEFIEAWAARIEELARRRD